MPRGSHYMGRRAFAQSAAHGMLLRRVRKGGEPARTVWHSAQWTRETWVPMGQFTPSGLRNRPPDSGVWSDDHISNNLLGPSLAQGIVGADGAVAEQVERCTNCAVKVPVGKRVGSTRDPSTEGGRVRKNKSGWVRSHPDLVTLADVRLRLLVLLDGGIDQTAEPTQDGATKCREQHTDN
jgi:hypothetical protein